MQPKVAIHDLRSANQFMNASAFNSCDEVAIHSEAFMHRRCNSLFALFFRFFYFFYFLVTTQVINPNNYRCGDYNAVSDITK